MAAPRTYAEEYRQAILQLVTEEGQTIAAACRQIAAGHKDLEPLTIPEPTAGDWVKAARTNDRPDLTDLELPPLLDHTARGLFDLVNAEIYRIKDAKGKADPDSLLTLARILKELQPLASHKRTGSKGDTEQTGLLGGMEKAATSAARGNNGATASRPVTTPATHG